MSSRLNDKKNTASKNQQSKAQANKKTAKQLANTTHVNKSQAFALSSTAFSVCVALSSYALPAIVNPALAAGPKNN